MLDFSKIHKPLTKSDLLKNVSPEQIFYHYFGNFIVKRKNYPSPFREDKKFSFGFFYNEFGELISNDFARDEKLDCIAFVAKKFGITYSEAIQKIMFDFNFHEQDVNCTPSIIESNSVLFDEKFKKKTKIQIIQKDFNEKELKFWNQYEITKEELINDDVYAYEAAYINKRFISSAEIRFAFYQKDLTNNGYFKLYQPYETDYKWVSNIPLSLPFGIDKLKYQSDTLIITKGKKEQIILKKLFPDVLATQNESLSSITNCIEESKKFKRTVVIYDADDPGVSACTEITQKYNWEYFNTPRYLFTSRKIKDVADYVFYYGIKSLEKRLKEKLIL